ncbi:MAG: tetratricopeptide repeat protein [Pirellulales bacterium]|nr:tetratricopeptide repeat protein [Pirellulales bacterium]
MNRRRGWVLGWCFAATLLPAAASAQQEWVGRAVMAKRGFKVKLGTQEVTGQWFPATVLKVQGDWLSLGRGWMHVSYALSLDEALKYFTGEIQRAPDAWTYTCRGLAWYEKRQLDNALKDYSEAIRRDPKYAFAYNNRGVVWEAKGALDNALVDYSEAIRLDPQNPFAFNNRGVVREAKRDYARALRDYSDAIRLDPQYATPFNHRAWLQATCPEDAIRNGKEALADATKACELTGWKNADRIDTLAAAYAEAGDFANAVKWEEKALELVADETLKPELKARLALYREGQPFRDRRK